MGRGAITPGALGDQLDRLVECDAVRPQVVTDAKADFLTGHFQQFKEFLAKTTAAKLHPVSGAIVFFEEFQGDGWDRQAKCRIMQNGWNSWYKHHSDINGYRLDLLRISGGAFEYYALLTAAEPMQQILEA